MIGCLLLAFQLCAPPGYSGPGYGYGYGYYQQPQVVYAQPQVYYQPQPIYYPPPPVYYQSPVAIRLNFGGHGGHRHHGRRHWR